MKFQSLFSRDGLSLDRLRTLVLVDEAGTIAAAAPQDRTRQSLFSRQLKELEHFFPVALKRTAGRTVTLTPAGRDLARLARAHLQALEEFHRASENRPLELTLGAGEALLHWHVLPRFARLQRAARDAVWHLRTLQNHAMSRQLADGSLDYALLRSDLVTGRLAGAAVGRLHYRLFIPDRLHPRGQPLELSAALAQLPIATQGDDTLFQRRLAAALERRGWTLRARLYGESFPHVAQAVATGCVAGLLPDLAAGAFDPAGTWSIPLTELTELPRDISLAWNPHHLAKREIAYRCREALAKSLRFDLRDQASAATR